MFALFFLRNIRLHVGLKRFIKTLKGDFAIFTLEKWTVA